MRASVLRRAVPQPAWRQIAGALCVATLVVAASPAVLAQEPSADATAQARIEFGQGVEAFEAEQFEVALRHFEAAWRLRPHPTVRVNLAASFAKLGRIAPAVLHYRAYLADRSVQLSRTARRDLQASLAALEESVGTVDVTVTPEDARLTVDGAEPNARDGARLYLVAGSHRIAASAPGRAAVTRTVTVTGGSSQRIDLELTAVEPGPTPREREPAPAPPVEQNPPPTEEIEPAETETVPTDALADEPRDEAPPVSSRSRGSTRTIVRWSLYGVAAAATVSAAVLGVMALGASDDFDDGATRIEQHDYASEAERAQLDRAARDDADRANALALWTDVSIGVALAAAVAGTVVLLTTPPRTDDADQAASPLRLAGGPTPGGGGAVSVSGQF